ncbi:xanthine dehydrogenase family protein molybdopterin-binding subunit [Arundinibacter roseus]|uniref:Xanthine dehydrogenase family protein molybdopterin-binding subunit n=1 Tax=Arundinibacter roseus TaxID=2070510 RepID=A0A4R4K3A6_9BACT|nr:molybdopterin cofactor-binding domain-containing protein [Arundinibacter roseus]TDB61808.1 xanthine dehydrogenase family protein molybdopterin-binding subunit [Arundinibacter roseus]
MELQEENNTQALASGRRDFLRLAGLTGVGLVLGFSAKASGQKTSVVNLSADSAAVLSFELHPFIVIDNAGGITLINHRPDMGQATWQSVPMMIAEELEVTLDQIKIRQSDGLRKYGEQLSGGSSTVRTGWTRLRQAGAAAREMFLQAAATEWKAQKSDCYAENGKIHHRPTGKSLSYGELVEQASALEVPADLPLKAKKDFKILGKALPRPEIPAKVTGVAEFGMDVEVPGMLYASIERSPMIHGKVVSFDDTNAKKVAGVTQVLKAERKLPYKACESVAVLANSYWAALQGRKALKIVWDNGTLAEELDSSVYAAKLRAAVAQEAPSYTNLGDVSTALASAAKKLDAVYETPFLAHAPMEPEVAIAHVKEDGSCEIWAPVQGPDGTIEQVSAYLGIKPEQVTVHVPFLGGAFGRKAYLDFVLEAVYLSKQTKTPVKVIWTREDDIQQGPFRPAMLSSMRGGVDEKGAITAFEHTLIGESISGQVFGFFPEGKPDPWAGEAISHEESPYAIPNLKVGFTRVKTEIPIVWWRSVYPSNSSFGHESFIDELAHAAGKDPLAVRKELMKDDKRFLNVLTLLEEKSGWNKTLPAGMGKGVAVAKSFGSVCAHAFFVKKTATGLVVDRVVTVLDCGMYVNPDNVRAQTEGNIAMGLTAATKPAITFAKGKAQQSNFHQYQLLRMDEMPKMEIHLVENEEAPGGVGEPGLPPVAPALCNAIFSATGTRIRTLPVDLKKLV